MRSTPSTVTVRAMVLAAGLGTRLGELSNERPKPLLPVANVPLIRYSLASLLGHGFSEVAVNLHHLGEQFVAELDGKTPGLSLTWSREPEILGTGGGLKQLGDWLTQGGQEPFLVMNGKLIIDVDLTDLVERHRQSGALATMVVREVPDAKRWGMVEVDDHDQVLRIIGEGQPGPAGHCAMFTGTHIISPELMSFLPSGVSCIIRQGYLPALRAGKKIAARLYQGYFEEHSTPQRYLEGNLAVIRGLAKLTYPPATLSGIAPSARIHSSAQLSGAFCIGPRATVGSGAKLRDVVLGDDAVVAPEIDLNRVVIWPGASASQSLHDAIVTTQGVFQLAQHAINDAGVS